MQTIKKNKLRKEDRKGNLSLVIIKKLNCVRWFFRCGLETVCFPKEVINADCDITVKHCNISLSSFSDWVLFFNSQGRALGIVVGCFVGMFPLLFYNSKEDHEEKSTHNEIKQ